MLIRLCQKFGEYNKVTSLIDCITCRPVPRSNCTADLIVLFFISSQVQDLRSGFGIR